MRFMQRIVAGTLLACGLLSNAAAGEWFYVARDSFSMVVLDGATAMIAGDGADVWTAEVTIDPQARWDTRSIRWNIDCREKGLREKAVRLYKNGEMIDETFADEPQWRVPRAASLESSLWLHVCRIPEPMRVESLDHVGDPARLAAVLKPELEKIRKGRH